MEQRKTVSVYPQGLTYPIAVSVFLFKKAFERAPRILIRFYMRVIADFISRPHYSLMKVIVLGSAEFFIEAFNLFEYLSAVATVKNRIHIAFFFR